MKGRRTGPSAPAFAAGFHLRLRAARKWAGLTQLELEGKAGFAVTTVSRYEKATGPLPRLEHVQRLAGALGCTVEHLLNDAAC